MIDFTPTRRDLDGHPDRSRLSEVELLAHIAFRENARQFTTAKRLGSPAARDFALVCDRIQAECAHRYAFETTYPHPRHGLVREYVCLCCNRGLLRRVVVRNT